MDNFVHGARLKKGGEEGMDVLESSSLACIGFFISKP